mmetsp:Transcript_99490/g.287192  ORF Transcript_99490/g.287192 Transcript_99490/m.287192 type:complete len:345 (-) Transcript_99490:45-1079(-)
MHRLQDEEVRRSRPTTKRRRRTRTRLRRHHRLLQRRRRRLPGRVRRSQQRWRRKPRSRRSQRRGRRRSRQRRVRRRRGKSRRTPTALLRSRQRIKAAQRSNPSGIRRRRAAMTATVRRTRRKQSPRRPRGTRSPPGKEVLPKSRRTSDAGIAGNRGTVRQHGAIAAGATAAGEGGGVAAESAVAACGGFDAGCVRLGFLHASSVCASSVAGRSRRKRNGCVWRAGDASPHGAAAACFRQGPSDPDHFLSTRLGCRHCQGLGALALLRRAMSAPHAARELANAACPCNARPMPDVWAGSVLAAGSTVKLLRAVVGARTQPLAYDAAVAGLGLPGAVRVLVAVRRS